MCLSYKRYNKMIRNISDDIEKIIQVINDKFIISRKLRYFIINVLQWKNDFNYDCKSGSVEKGKVPTL